MKTSIGWMKGFDGWNERMRSNDPPTSNPMILRDPQRTLTKTGQRRRVPFGWTHGNGGTVFPSSLDRVQPLPSHSIRHPRQPPSLPSVLSVPSPHGSDRRVFPRRGRVRAIPPHDPWMGRWVRFNHERLSFQTRKQSVETISGRPSTAPFESKDKLVTRPSTTFAQPTIVLQRRGGWNNDAQEVRPPRKRNKAMEDRNRRTLVDINGRNDETWSGGTVPERTQTRGRRQTKKRIEKDANHGCIGAGDNNWLAWEQW